MMRREKEQIVPERDDGEGSPVAEIRRYITIYISVWNSNERDNPRTGSAFRASSWQCIIV
jgi:hypothetical protein